MNFIIFVLSELIAKLLSTNHLIIWERTKFDTVENCLKFLFEIMVLVSSANNIGSDTTFILRGREFIYIYICLQTVELILKNSMFQCLIDYDF